MWLVIRFFPVDSNKRENILSNEFRTTNPSFEKNKSDVLFFIFHIKTLNRKYRYNSVIIQILSFHFAVLYYNALSLSISYVSFAMRNAINGVQIDQRIWSNEFFDDMKYADRISRSMRDKKYKNCSTSFVIGLFIYTYIYRKHDRNLLQTNKFIDTIFMFLF